LISEKSEKKPRKPEQRKEKERREEKRGEDKTVTMIQYHPSAFTLAAS
jgi:hypothetical protein